MCTHRAVNTINAGALCQKLAPELKVWYGSKSEDVHMQDMHSWQHFKIQ